ncbi:MAG: pyridoxamine 5'-phosphate oxidase family protein [Acidimicrobiales bacterium]
MALRDGRTWMEHLTPHACWDLLCEEAVGRVGVLVDSAPEIYPVNYAVCDETIVFRTDPGTKLRAIDRSPSVCFEADRVDPETGSGWSVLIKGRAVELTSAADLGAASELPLHFWTSGDKSHWVSIVSAEITGRRIGPAGR